MANAMDAHIVKARLQESKLTLARAIRRLDRFVALAEKRPQELRDKFSNCVALNDVFRTLPLPVGGRNFTKISVVSPIFPKIFLKQFLIFFQKFRIIAENFPKNGIFGILNKIGQKTEVIFVKIQYFKIWKMLNIRFFYKLLKRFS